MDPELDQRISQIERHLAEQGHSAINAAQQSQGVGAKGVAALAGAATDTGLIPEAQITWDTTGGHNHAAGNDLVVTVYKNGSATALTVSVVGAAGTEQSAQAAVTPIAFAAGDTVTVQAKKNGAPAAVQAVVQVWGFFTG